MKVKSKSTAGQREQGTWDSMAHSVFGLLQNEEFCFINTKKYGGCIKGYLQIRIFVFNFQLGLIP